jgi:hypothetical protein
MSVHAATAIRAYLKASGLPEFDEAKWLEARKILLGKDANVSQTAITLQIENTAPQEHQLLESARALRKAGP